VGVYALYVSLFLSILSNLQYNDAKRSVLALLFMMKILEEAKNDCMFFFY
jgi:hypothetical protein